MSNLRTMAKLVGNRQGVLLVSLWRRVLTPVCRAAFLTSAVHNGVLRLLADQPRTAEELALALGAPAEAGPRLRGWLDVGVELGELGRRGDRYRLRGRLSRALVRQGNEAVAASLEQMVSYQIPALLHAPAMIKDGRRLTLGDMDGEVTARASRVLEPFIEAAIERVVDRGRPVRLLDIGCGTGVYSRHAARLNPLLTGLAVDLQQDVADQAAANLARWGLADRVDTRRADLRELEPGEPFDLVMMHNNIYYFSEGERVAVLERARRLLAPGGRLLLTTSCRDGNVGLRILNLWFDLADFGGPLPHHHELLAQLEGAGFTEVQATRLMPGQAFRAFVGVNG
ncbi:class I SAM-dependent methyltransferase [Streptomyces sp. SAJ15]|uniref:class I SAM-dependent methyltransferase n=1 Tax=Streptomyces sp. SAJ15 TaxID=2011095 RepID=UPI0021B36CB2|nr:class I SAM-dependent methyltransferase [Streptomyces sp. SAJ15]